MRNLRRFVGLAEPSPDDEVGAADTDRGAVDAALLARKVTMHRANLRLSTLGSMGGALLLAATLRSAVASGALLIWLALLGVVLTARTLAALRPARGIDLQERNRLWLLRCRLGFLIHGFAWGAVGALPLAAGDAPHEAVLVVIATVVMTSSFVLTAFDLTAALWFGVPIGVLIGLRLFLHAEPAYSTLGFVVLGTLLFLSLAARRSQGVLRKYELLRLSQAAQADALRSSEHLLERTGETAGVGGWALDLATMGLRLTAQAYRIHDVPPVQKPTFEGFVSLYGPAEQAHLRAGLMQVIATATPFDHELRLTTLRGRRCWVRLIGHAQVVEGRVVGIDGVVQDITERKHSEQALQAASEALAQKTQALQDTLDSISQGIVSLDALGRPRVYNRRALELLDLPEQLMGADGSFDEIVRYQVARGDFEADASIVDAEGKRHQFSGGPPASPEVYVRRGRASQLLEVRTRQLAGGGFVRTYADVTAYIEVQRALRGSEAELRALLDAFPGFIAVIGPDQVYTYANERFAALLGKPREDIIDHHARQVLGEERFGPLNAQTSKALAGEVLVTETEYAAHGSGERTWIQVTHAIGLEDSHGRRNTYAFGVDISARKRAELALNAAKNEAERANQAKSLFLSSMSHELRTPMNAILGFGQLLIADDAHPLVEAQREYVREILRGGRHLLNLINEVLDLAQVETGKLRISLESVCVLELLHECLALLRPLAQGAGVSLHLRDEAECDLLVQADRTRLKQVLLNLLSNAIKYNRVGGQVRVSCAGNAGGLRLAIADDGAGLDADQRARLFQAFERLDAAATVVEGAGLGLVLSKHLMSAMRGEIGLESEPGQGSTFWIRLPRAAAPVFGLGAKLPAVGAAHQPEPAAVARTALYIEDNPVNLLLMEAMLSRVPGLRLLSAALPSIGLSMVAAAPPDLILLDIQLPEIDGYEVLRRLRAEPSSRHIPVIAVSANAMRGDVEKGLAAGFVRYLTKPLDMVTLIGAVEQALAASPQHDDAQ